MRCASSLFDIDQEPLLEPVLLEAAADDGLVWDAGLDEFPTTPEPSGDLEADEPGRRSLVPGRRSCLLVAMATVGAVGLLGSRLTQDAEPPSTLPSTAPPISLPRTALGPPAVVATAHPSRAGRQSQRARPLRAKMYRATRRERTRRAQRVPRAPRAEYRRRAVASPARSAVPVPAPTPVTPTPPAPAPAPEPQGFTGEFF